MVTSRLTALVVDATDPRRLARFWSHALDWALDEAATDAVDVVPTDGTPFSLTFVASAAPKETKNCIHLDLTSSSPSDRRTFVERLRAAGAQPVEVGQTAADRHVVLADPEGNELCVIEPGNAFLAGCGRVGSITCDGSPAVGRFWSVALDWPLVWDQDEETAVRDPSGTGPFVTWGPPVPPAPTGNRLRLELTPVGPPAAEVDRLTAAGATAIGPDRRRPDRLVMADPDGNELLVVVGSPAGARGILRR